MLQEVIVFWWLPWFRDWYGWHPFQSICWGVLFFLYICCDADLFGNSKGRRNGKNAASSARRVVTCLLASWFNVKCLDLKQGRHISFSRICCCFFLVIAEYFDITLAHKTIVWLVRRIGSVIYCYDESLLHIIIIDIDIWFISVQYINSSFKYLYMYIQ